VAGQSFSQTSITDRAQEAVIDETAAETLFGTTDPLGQVVILDNVPVRVIGVVEDETMGFGFGNSINVWAPYTTVMARLLGQAHLGGITVRVADSADMAEAEERITAILSQRHGTVDFSLQNTDT